MPEHPDSARPDAAHPASEQPDSAHPDPEPATAPEQATTPRAARAEGGLSERDRTILAIEGRTFRYVGAKERRIREDLGMTPTQYFVRLNSLLEEPAALREAPALVHRLRARRVSSDSAGPDREALDGLGQGRVA